MHCNFPHTSGLCLMISYLLMFPSAAGHWWTCEWSHRGMWVVGALHCDRNMCCENKLQACLFKKQGKRLLRLHSLNPEDSLHGTEADPSPIHYYTLQLYGNVWKITLDWPRQQSSISRLTAATLPLHCPPLWACKWRWSDLASDNSNNSSFWPQAYQSVGNTVSDH